MSDDREQEDRRRRRPGSDAGPDDPQGTDRRTRSLQPFGDVWHGRHRVDTVFERDAEIARIRSRHPRADAEGHARELLAAEIARQERAMARPPPAGSEASDDHGRSTGLAARSTPWRRASRRSGSVGLEPSASTTWKASTTWSRTVPIFADFTDSPAVNRARATS